MALINLIVTKTLNAKCEVSHEEDKTFCSIFTSGTACARSLPWVFVKMWLELFYPAEPTNQCQIINSFTLSLFCRSTNKFPSYLTSYADTLIFYHPANRWDCFKQFRPSCHCLLDKWWGYFKLKNHHIVQGRSRSRSYS